MAVFHRVEDRRAGPEALGILVPPGQRTVVILRPRALDWDLLPVQRTENASLIRFCDFGRDEAALLARLVQRELELAAAVGTNPVEQVALSAGGYVVWLNCGDFRWVACLRLPGKAYEPAVFSLEEATQATAEIARFLWPAANGRQEFYFNTQNFSRNKT